MQKSLTYAYIFLIVLTLVAAFVASYIIDKKVVYIIVILSVIKFLTVGFQFMELKQTHTFWKALFIAYSTIIGGILLILL